MDLLNPLAASQKAMHKKKRLVQGPNSYFMDVKCQGCFNITTVFSHAQSVVACPNCNQVLCHPTGGKARLVDGIFGLARTPWSNPPPRNPIPSQVQLSAHAQIENNGMTLVY